MKCYYFLLVSLVNLGPAFAQSKFNFSSRASYVYVYQSNQGNLHTGLAEVGINFTPSKNFYLSSYAGVYPITNYSNKSAVGATASGYIGFDIDKFIQFEFGVAYNTWADLTEDTISGSTRIVKPISSKFIHELFASANFPGNSEGSTPAYIVSTGIGYNF